MIFTVFIVTITNKLPAMIGRLHRTHCPPSWVSLTPQQWSIHMNILRTLYLKGLWYMRQTRWETTFDHVPNYHLQPTVCVLCMHSVSPEFSGQFAQHNAASLYPFSLNNLIFSPTLHPLRLLQFTIIDHLLMFRKSSTKAVLNSWLFALKQRSETLHDDFKA